MFTIRTYKAPDQYGGIGVFAGQDIKKGDVVWRYAPGMTWVFTIPQYHNIIATNEGLAFALKQYGFPDYMEVDGIEQRVVGLDQGDPCFTNHSDDANTGWTGEDGLNFALRDIKMGEEITYNYFDFVDDLSGWTDVQTCTQFLMDQGRYKKTDPIKKAA